ncbi:MAG: enolase C-terminal domain-like protein [Candidatus Zixiibacteriota bacterium]
MQCEVRPIELQLLRKFSVAGGSTFVKRNCLFIIDNLGIGEAAGSVKYGAQAEQIELELAYAADVINRLQCDVEEWVRDNISNMCSPAACAISTAYSDYLCKQNNQSLYEFYELEKPEPKPTSVTVSLGDEKAIQRFIEYGNRILKIKMDADEERGQAIIDTINNSENVLYRIDANESWTPKFARQFISKVDAAKVEMIEQPFSSADAASWKKFGKKTDIPLFMDESLDNPVDIDDVADFIDGVNVKIQKSGRLEKSIMMMRRAKDCGLKTMLGCMIESSVGIATAYHLSSLADFVDLDGRLLIHEDGFSGLTYEGGAPSTQDNYGHGVVFAK